VPLRSALEKPSLILPLTIRLPAARSVSVPSLRGATGEIPIRVQGEVALAANLNAGGQGEVAAAGDRSENARRVAGEAVGMGDGLGHHRVHRHAIEAAGVN
jgi:hypothetical protein